MNSPATLDHLLGRLIGDRQRYRLDKRLGGGGMGDVFLAMDTLLGQPVALKLLKEKLIATEDLRKRFEREVALCAALKSDHIVQVSDYGVTLEGHPFYVMEYLRGQTLGQLLWRERCLPFERAVTIITQVCAGLQLAHEGINLWRDGANSSELIKVVHRDLKPDNIFLVTTTLGELVKILDFGVAKILHDQIDSTNATGFFLGTCQYASPEQFEVDKDLDERADIYSLGIILYEMLTGTDPFSVDPLVRKHSGVAWALAHISKPPVPLRARAGCEHLPLELEAAVMQCLQKAPEQRFSSVKELNMALLASVPQLSDRPLSYTQPLTKVNTYTQQQADAATQSITPFVNTVIYTPETTTPPPSYSRRSRPKSPLRLVSVGISMAFAVTALGIYYSPLLSNTPIVQKLLPHFQERELTLANSLSGHSNSIWSVAISPDGQKIASGSLDKTIKIWNLANGKIIRTLTGHTDAVRAVAISPSGQTLASGGGDKKIKIWNLQTGELLRTLSGHSNSVWSVAISPDGQTLVSGCYEGNIKIWNLQTGKLLHRLTGHSEGIWSIAISPDGQTIVSGSKDKTIKIWNLQTGKLLRTFSGHSDAVRSVAISLDGQTLVSGSWDKTIKIWNLQTGELLRNLSGHTNRVISVAISPDGQKIASGSLDKTIQIWNLSTGDLLDTLSGHSDWVISVAISPDRQTLVSGSKDNKIKIWR